MRVLHRVVFILLIVGVVGAMSGVGEAVPTITFKDCASPSPSPTPTSPAPTPPVSQPPITPTPSPSPTPGPGRTPGPDDCTPKSGSVVFDTQTLAFVVQSDGFQPIKNIKVQLKAYKDSGAVDASAPIFNGGYTCNNQPDPRTAILVPWDTKTDTPHNGHYEVVVDVGTFSDPTCGGGNGRTAEAIRTDLKVDNAPDAVGAPHIIATTSSTVTIGWDASTAPDVTRYEVYRAVTSSAKNKPSPKDFQLWGYSTSPSFRDTQISAGTYWYAVMVTRRSVVTPDSGISSPLSDPSPPVTVAAPVVHNGGSGPQSTVRRYIPLNPIVLPPSQNVTAAPVPDAPYSAQLPYGNAPEGGSAGAVTAGGGKNTESGATDPRGPVLPVAVGAFLVSAALALGRMPY